jgi:hypothetical protein
MFTTRKTMYPGAAVLDAEFAAHATPEQAAAIVGHFGTWADIDPGRGIWGWYDLTEGRDLLQFDRTTGAIEVAS